MADGGLKTRLGGALGGSAGAKAGLNDSVTAGAGIAEGAEDSCWISKGEGSVVLGPLEFVSIVRFFTLMPDNRRSRTPECPFISRLGILRMGPFEAVIGEEDEAMDRLGGGGSAPTGGGCAGGGIGFACNCFASDGSIELSATVDNDVAAVAGFEPIELPHVRPENPLESDWRGSADMD